MEPGLLCCAAAAVTSFTLRRSATMIHRLGGNLPEPCYALRASMQLRSLLSNSLAGLFAGVAIGCFCCEPDRISWEHLLYTSPLIVASHCLAWSQRRLASRLVTPYWQEDTTDSTPVRLFISYKSEDSDLVRQVSELLLASGRHIWVDQYCIPLFNRETFQEQYLDAIGEAKVFVVFLHPLYYSGSEYCEEELTMIAQRARSREARAVLTVVTSDSSLGSEADERLRLIERARTTSQDPREITQFICREGGLRQDPLSEGVRPDAESRLYSATHFETRVSFDIGGWQHVDMKGEDLRHSVRDFVGPAFEAQLNGGRALLRWSLGPDPDGCSLSDLFVQRSIDDRELSHRMRQFAEGYMRNQPGIACLGTHAVHIEHAGHLALTYWGGGYWTRLYSIMLKRPREDTGEVWEAHLHFSFRGTFGQFCLSTVDMDRLAKSFRWELNEDLFR